ncbi:MAG: hypothetical protein ABIO78_07110 [Thermoanaerobaculia bacterium]
MRQHPARASLTPSSTLAPTRSTLGTYSSWAHVKGVPGKVIAQIMGHAKADTTLNIYTQVLDGSLRTAADRVGSELFTIVHKPEGAEDVTR